MSKLQKVLGITAVSSFLVLGGCGGSDSDGGGSSGPNPNIKTTAATVSTSNAQDLGVAAARGIKKAVFDDEAQGNVPGIGGVPSGVDLSDFYDDFCDSGSISVTGSNDFTSTNIKYNNCSYGGIVINGTVSTKISNNGDTVTTTYNNLTVTDQTGQVSSLDNYNVTCTGLNSGQYNCTFLTDFSVSGEAYQLSDVSVSGSASSGYDVTVTVADTENGSVTVQTTASVTFDCPNEEPGSGAATFSGANGSSGTINFDSCTGFTITVDGVAESYSWSDIEI